MAKKIIYFVIGLLLFLIVPSRAFAVVDPLASENNKVGVHILSPDELESAAKLVNNDGKGSWGYVVVPIQATDRDRIKWEKFMKKARELKVIPIIRVATLVNQAHWEEPNNYDLVDFANFLNDLAWPTKNRYVIIFNEVNRADEYGGFVSPEKYADILSNAISIFKERNEDFFMLPAGMDDAAADGPLAMKWSEYIRRMEIQHPGVLGMLDGWVSHSYPNYGFVGKVSDFNDHSIRSFQFELNLIRNYTNRKLPVFITETGWDIQTVGEVKVAENFNTAFSTAWNNGQIVTVAPFVLMAGDGPFTRFSLLRKDSSHTLVYDAISQQAKIGKPVEASVTEPLFLKGVSLVKDGNDAFWTGIRKWEAPKVENLWEKVIEFIKPKKDQKLRMLKVGELLYQVEIADEAAEKEKGLSGRDRLPATRGMLFTFVTPIKPGFWMPDMHFDIDIVWIRNNKVIGVSVGDKSKPNEILYPPSEIDSVLEVNKNSGIKVGDSVELE